MEISCCLKNATATNGEKIVIVLFFSDFFFFYKLLSQSPRLT